MHDHPGDFLIENLARVRTRIADACARFGRDPGEVRLLAVSKTRPAALIETALAAGQHDFGENYLQDAVDKIERIGNTEAVWHYIGAIQSNKTGPIAENFSWVHTVASEKIARRLNNQAPATLNVLVQVNVDRQASKAGIAPEALPGLIESMLPMDRLALRGLMTMPAPADDFDSQRQPFRELRRLLANTVSRFGDELPAFDQLSMGMTADLEAAVAEGATWLRIGTAIFGTRDN